MEVMINIFELAKTAKKILANQDQIKQKMEKIKKNPPIGLDSKKMVLAHFNIDQHRLLKIETTQNIPSEFLMQVTEAVNDAFDKMDELYKDFEKI